MQVDVRSIGKGAEHELGRKLKESIPPFSAAVSDPRSYLQLLPLFFIKDEPWHVGINNPFPLQIVSVTVLLRAAETKPEYTPSLQGRGTMTEEDGAER